MVTQLTFPDTFPPIPVTPRKADPDGFGMAGLYSVSDVLHGLGLGLAEFVLFIERGCLKPKQGRIGEKSIARFIVQHYPMSVQITPINADWIIGIVAGVKRMSATPCPTCGGAARPLADATDMRVYDFESVMQKLGLRRSFLSIHRQTGCLAGNVRTTTSHYSPAQIALYIRRHYPMCVGTGCDAEWIVRILVENRPDSLPCGGCRALPTYLHHTTRRYEM